MFFFKSHASPSGPRDKSPASVISAEAELVVPPRHDDSAAIVNRQQLSKEMASGSTVADFSRKERELRETLASMRSPLDTSSVSPERGRGRHNRNINNNNSNTKTINKDVSPDPSRLPQELPEPVRRELYDVPEQRRHERQRALFIFDGTSNNNNNNSSSPRNHRRALDVETIFERYSFVGQGVSDNNSFHDHKNDGGLRRHAVPCFESPTAVRELRHGEHRTVADVLAADLPRIRRAKQLIAEAERAIPETQRAKAALNEQCSLDVISSVGSILNAKKRKRDAKSLGIKYKPYFTPTGLLFDTSSSGSSSDDGGQDDADDYSGSENSSNVSSEAASGSDANAGAGSSPNDEEEEEEKAVKKRRNKEKKKKKKAKRAKFESKLQQIMDIVDSVVNAEGRSAGYDRRGSGGDTLDSSGTFGSFSFTPSLAGDESFNTVDDDFDGESGDGSSGTGDDATNSVGGKLGSAGQSLRFLRKLKASQARRKSDATTAATGVGGANGGGDPAGAAAAVARKQLHQQQQLAKQLAAKRSRSPSKMRAEMERLAKMRQQLQTKRALRDSERKEAQKSSWFKKEILQREASPVLNRTAVHPKRSNTLSPNTMRKAEFIEFADERSDEDNDQTMMCVNDMTKRDNLFGRSPTPRDGGDRPDSRSTEPGSLSGRPIGKPRQQPQQRNGGGGGDEDEEESEEEMRARWALAEHAASHARAILNGPDSETARVAPELARRGGKHPLPDDESESEAADWGTSAIGDASGNGAMSRFGKQLLDMRAVDKLPWLFIVQERPKQREPLVEVSATNRSENAQWLLVDFSRCDGMEVKPNGTTTVSIGGNKHLVCIPAAPKQQQQVKLSPSPSPSPSSQTVETAGAATSKKLSEATTATTTTATITISSFPPSSSSATAAAAAGGGAVLPNTPSSPVVASLQPQQQQYLRTHVATMRKMDGTLDNLKRNIDVIPVSTEEALLLRSALTRLEDPVPGSSSSQNNRSSSSPVAPGNNNNAVTGDAAASLLNAALSGQGTSAISKYLEQRQKEKKKAEERAARRSNKPAAAGVTRGASSPQGLMPDGKPIVQDSELQAVLNDAMANSKVDASVLLIALERLRTTRTATDPRQKNSGKIGGGLAPGDPRRPDTAATASEDEVDIATKALLFSVRKIQKEKKEAKEREKTERQRQSAADKARDLDRKRTEAQLRELEEYREKEKRQREWDREMGNKPAMEQTELAAFVRRNPSMVAPGGTTNAKKNRGRRGRILAATAADSTKTTTAGGGGGGDVPSGDATIVALDSTLVPSASPRRDGGTSSSPFVRPVLTAEMRAEEEKQRQLDYQQQESVRSSSSRGSDRSGILPPPEAGPSRHQLNHQHSGHSVLVNNDDPTITDADLEDARRQQQQRRTLHGPPNASSKPGGGHDAAASWGVSGGNGNARPPRGTGGRGNNAAGRRRTSDGGVDLETAASNFADVFDEHPPDDEHDDNQHGGAGRRNHRLHSLPAEPSSGGGHHTAPSFAAGGGGVGASGGGANRRQSDGTVLHDNAAWGRRRSTVSGGQLGGTAGANQRDDDGNDNNDNSASATSPGLRGGRQRRGGNAAVNSASRAVFSRVAGSGGSGVRGHPSNDQLHHAASWSGPVRGAVGQAERRRIEGNIKQNIANRVLGRSGQDDKRSAAAAAAAAEAGGESSSPESNRNQDQQQQQQHRIKDNNAAANVSPRHRTRRNVGSGDDDDAFDDETGISPLLTHGSVRIDHLLPSEDNPPDDFTKNPLISDRILTEAFERAVALAQEQQKRKNINTANDVLNRDTSTVSGNKRVASAGGSASSPGDMFRPPSQRGISPFRPPSRAPIQTTEDVRRALQDRVRSDVLSANFGEDEQLRKLAEEVGGADSDDDNQQQEQQQQQNRPETAEAIRDLVRDHVDLTNALRNELAQLARMMKNTRSGPEITALRRSIVAAAWKFQRGREINLRKLILLLERKTGGRRHKWLPFIVNDDVYAEAGLGTLDGSSVAGVRSQGAFVMNKSRIMTGPMYYLAVIAAGGDAPSIPYLHMWDDDEVAAMEAQLADLAPGSTQMTLTPRQPPAAKGLLRHAPKAPPALGQDDRDQLLLKLRAAREGRGCKFHGVLVLDPHRQQDAGNAPKAQPTLSVTALQMESPRAQ